MRSRGLFLGYVGVAMAIGACHEPAAPSGLVEVLSVSRSAFYVGDTVTVTGTLENQGTAKEAIPADLCGAVGFIVKDSVGAAVFEQSVFCLSSLSASSDSLAPGERKLLFSFPYSGTLGSNAGQSPRTDTLPLASGTYMITGKVANWRMSPATITILHR